VLRAKWIEVPFGQYERRSSSELLSLSDAEILEKWQTSYLESSAGRGFSTRGWYHTLYRDVFRGKKVLDFGCGLGVDSVFFASHGACITALDVVGSNIAFVQAVCKLKRITNISFCYMEDLNSLEALPRDFDVIFCCGSFHHAPLEMARMEAQALLQHLPVGGRWIELSYPKVRWEREGQLPEAEWGCRTDGSAPWVEWHDLPKLDYLLSPAVFDVVLAMDFHGSDFNWFDLIRRE